MGASRLHCSLEEGAMANLNETTWAVNESLLQSYRSISVSSESFLLAVGAIAAGKSVLVLLGTAALALILIWLIWFPVVRARHRVVDYHKHVIQLDEQARSKLCTEHEYVHDSKLRKRANDLFGIKSNWRATRVKLDLLVPLLFTCMWFILLIYGLNLAN
jgi:hypothetical protein